MAPARLKSKNSKPSGTTPAKPSPLKKGTGVLLQFHIFQFFRRNLLICFRKIFLKRLGGFREGYVRTRAAHASAGTGHALDHAALQLAGFGKRENLLAVGQSFRVFNVHRNVRIVFLQTGFLFAGVISSEVL